MKGRYLLDYLDENNFKKLERSLKKYNMMAYKRLQFDFYPKLRKGELRLHSNISLIRKGFLCLRVA